MPEADFDPPAEGADFPRVDGRRSSTAVAREVFAKAADPVSPELASRIRATGNWRKDYVEPSRDLVAVAAQGAANARTVAGAGLAELHRSFVFGRFGEERPLAEAVADTPEEGFTDVVVTSSRSPEGGGGLALPYHGQLLRDHRLMAQAHLWVDSGVAEPSLVGALGSLVDNPDWLDLSDTHVVVFGAGAELGPLRHLLSWGAHVWAVDLPRPDVWRRIVGAVSGTRGTLHVPVPTTLPTPAADDVETLVNMAGADIIAQAPEIRGWLRSIDQDFVIGNYGYADGALHVRLSMAVDAIAVDVLKERPGTTLAFLATPTDAFAVPEEALRASRAAWKDNKIARATRRPLKLANLFQPNYRNTVTNEYGHEVGIADCIVPQQGPNYLLAKRMQRFRAVTSRGDGVRISLNVAPATRTVSVVKNKLMAAAYVGADRFGIEVFEPETCNALMASLLVRDLRDPASLSNPEVAVSNPMDLFADAAVHGGFWRTPYDPRSVLGVAAVIGMLEQQL